VVNPGQARALLYFGGNGEAIQHNRNSLARWLPQHTVYLVAYRGYGASEGEPSEALLLEDALALYDAVVATHDEIDVVGRSLGSGVAVHVAVQRPVARLVLVTPFDSAQAVAQAAYPWVPVAWLMQDRYDSLGRAARVEAPTLVLSAGRDRVVPQAHTAALLDAFAQPPQHIAFPAADHNDIHDQPGYAAAMTAFLARPP
jgi:pimeloyl-ACP methyl ester carboxylesterase